MRARIVPDRKLAARKAARGHKGSVPLGAFLNVLSQDEHKSRRSQPLPEDVRTCLSPIHLHTL